MKGKIWVNKNEEIGVDAARIVKPNANFKY